MFLAAVVFIATFISFYCISPYMCKQTLQQEYVGGAYANFPQ